MRQGSSTGPFAAFARRAHRKLKWIFDGLIIYIPNGRIIDASLSVLQFILSHGRIPRLKNPKTFNERLLREKLERGDDPQRIAITDKALVKSYIAASIGTRYAVPTLGVYSETPPRASLAGMGSVVVKPTHCSGEVCFYEDSEEAYAKLQGKAQRWFRMNYARYARERNYLRLVPKIIVEPDLGKGKGTPADYKIFCFYGKPRLIQVDVARFSGHRRALFDQHWSPLPAELIYPQPTQAIQRPERLEEMLALSEILARPFPFMRVDWYDTADGIYVGELTSFPENCEGRFTNGFDAVVGGWWREEARRASLGPQFEAGPVA